MKGKKPQSFNDQHPTLAFAVVFILPLAAGFFAWFFSRNVALGVGLAVVGLIANWIQVRMKK